MPFGLRHTVTTMLIQLASDLHLEFLARAFPGNPTLSPAPGADVLVLAGDIGSGASAIELFRHWPVPVLYLAGNHEAYGQSSWPDVVARCKRAAKGTAVRFLERDIVELDGVRFLGCTLWTDYCLHSADSQAEHMAVAQDRLNDHRLICNSDGAQFLPADALGEHQRARTWLADALSSPFSGKTVVVSHHAPHSGSVHPRYADDPLNAAFASDLTPMMDQVNLWLHGHVHDSFDYHVGACRVVANPRGYARNISSADSAESLIFENPSFQGACIIEV